MLVELEERKNAQELYLFRTAVDSEDGTDKLGAECEYHIGRTN